MNPQPTEATANALVDWCYAALTHAGLKGRRVVVFGHDSMGMETALAHVIPTRRTFGLEITRLDMKLLADMLAKGAYDRKELERPAPGSTSTWAIGWTCSQPHAAREVQPVAGHVPDRPRPAAPT